ncbi:Ohr family peroxiredoxin [Methyloversatilis thermotolerans]|uniref:Ohr family peroxiredoxin n=1 Tax=Methyloversatilis thermotolerans TaxID=1346290 RepID=UPI000360D4DE|nr:Ohr family peroxiredoxin [Methyloversatilis thermotolerans]
MDLIYSTRIFSQGGRNGRVQSEDGQLKLQLAAPESMGGSKPGANPEQLFAAAYAACFEHSVRHIARADRLPLKGCMVEAEISLFKNFEEAYRMALRFTVILNGIDQPTADSLVERALKVCPYTDATKNNVTVSASAVLEDPALA